MVDHEITPGRPYGGCAILWRRSLGCKVTPISSNNRRLCMVKMEFSTYTILLCTVYIPCDTEYDNNNNEMYNDVLLEIVKQSYN